MDGRPRTGTRACTSLNATPVPQSTAKGDVFAVELGVHDGGGGREFGARQVVVGHHHIDSRLACRPDHVHRRDAAIAGQDQAGADLSGPGKPGLAEVVAVAHPVRHEGHHGGPGLSERPGEEGGGALPIHVVVAVDEDGLAGSHRTHDNLDGGIHPAQRARVAEIVQRWTEEPARAGHVAEAPLHEQRGERRAALTATR